MVGASEHLILAEMLRISSDFENELEDLSEVGINLNLKTINEIETTLSFIGSKSNLGLTLNNLIREYRTLISHLGL